MGADVADLPLGSRVVVRHRLPAADEFGHTLTDVVGDLIASDTQSLTVRTGRGDVQIDKAVIEVAKVVPPRPSRRGAPHRALSVEDLQRVMVDAWPPIEREGLGDWVLRAGRGFTLRANSCVTSGSPGVPVGAAVDLVEGWYVRRGLPSDLCLAGPVGFDPASDPLGADLLKRGYAGRVPTLTLTAATAQVRHAAEAALTRAAAPMATAVTVSPDLTDEWLGTMARYRPIDPAAATAILTGSPQQFFASARHETGTVGIARLALAHAWGGIGAMWVDPSHRRTGLGLSMLGQLAEVAGQHGIRSLHLQTDATNDAALALYRAVGFTEHHAYVNLSKELS